MTLKYTEKQIEAMKLMSGDPTYVMLFGGSRSGKTFITVRQIVTRAIKAGGSRHTILRFRFNHVVNSVVYDTFPKVMKTCYPTVNYKLDKTHWFAKLDNGSEIWFGGLDDKERTEKILGMEFSTIYLNESSQIAWGSVGIAMTRLAQKVNQQIIVNKKIEMKPLKPRMFFDCNPPDKNHWTYKLFVQRRDPETGTNLYTPEDYSYFQINPKDNVDNLSDGYLKTLEGLSARLRKRFLEGEFTDANPNQLFTDLYFDRWRTQEEDLPEFVRVVVGVDPSGAGDSDNADNDAIGIIVGALGTDGNAYLLEDCTVKAGPATWGKVATSAYDRHNADILVGENNYGGAMVEMVIQASRPRTNYKSVLATRSKMVRAEPFAPLYEQGKIRHVGRFADLEEELGGFSTNGYNGSKSPNRADAWIWVLTELFPAILRSKVEKKSQNAPKKQFNSNNSPGFWM